MPTNLPPEYFEAEKRYRAATSPIEKIATLEELIGTIPKHKGTDKLRADFRRRLSKLKSSSQTKKGTSRRDIVFHIDREGAGQVVVIGPTNVGKSSLVAALTNATPEIADFPHTTWQPTPGMMPFENIQIQLIDTPPLSRDYVEPELFELIKRADLALLLVDLQTDPMQQLDETIAILEERRIVPRHWQDGYPDQPRWFFVPCLVLANKYDDETADEDFEIFCQLVEGDWPLLPVSTTTGRNLERLKPKIFQQLEIVRVYSKAPGKEPDFTSPFIMKKGETVEVFAGKVHQDFVERLKSARVWGQVGFDGQMVRRDHVLHDGDVVELHL
ncbi:MAG: 50S ribosome-binding GTPase [Anaerolineae bacterium]|nr:50S ribosome-binding GTPase [Anaerolineae bacterium]